MNEQQWKPTVSPESFICGICHMGPHGPKDQPSKCTASAYVSVRIGETAAWSSIWMASLRTTTSNGSFRAIKHSLLPCRQETPKAPQIRLFSLGARESHGYYRNSYHLRWWYRMPGKWLLCGWRCSPPLCKGTEVSIFRRRVVIPKREGLLTLVR